jgi:hypothetical protein
MLLEKNAPMVYVYNENFCPEYPADEIKMVISL